MVILSSRLPLQQKQHRNKQPIIGKTLSKGVFASGCSFAMMTLASSIYEQSYRLENRFTYFFLVDGAVVIGVDVTFRFFGVFIHVVSKLLSSNKYYYLLTTLSFNLDQK